MLWEQPLCIQKESKVGTLFSFLKTKKYVSCLEVLKPFNIFCYMMMSKPLCGTKDLHSCYIFDYIHWKDTFLFKVWLENELNLKDDVHFVHLASFHCSAGLSKQRQWLTYKAWLFMWLFPELFLAFQGDSTSGINL